MSSLRVDDVEHDERPRTEPWDGVIRWGGLSLLAAAVILVAFLVAVVATGQDLPVPAEEMLDDPGRPTALFILAALPWESCYWPPAALKLYMRLRRAGRARMLIASTLMIMSSVLFVVSRGPIISLSQVSGEYQNATTEATRAAYMASADLAIETQNTYSTIALILLSTASILIGTVLLRSTLVGRGIAIVTIVAGVASVFAPFLIIAGVPEAIGFIGLALGVVWQAAVGLTLYKVAQGGVARPDSDSEEPGSAWAGPQWPRGDVGGERHLVGRRERAVS